MRTASDTRSIPPMAAIGRLSDAEPAAQALMAGEGKYPRRSAICCIQKDPPVLFGGPGWIVVWFWVDYSLYLAINLSSILRFSVAILCSSSSPLCFGVSDMLVSYAKVQIDSGLIVFEVLVKLVLRLAPEVIVKGGGIARLSLLIVIMP